MRVPYACTFRSSDGTRSLALSLKPGSSSCRITYLSPIHASEHSWRGQKFVRTYGLPVLVIIVLLKVSWIQCVAVVCPILVQTSIENIHRITSQRRLFHRLTTLKEKEIRRQRRVAIHFLQFIFITYHSQRRSFWQQTVSRHVNSVNGFIYLNHVAPISTIYLKWYIQDL